MIIATIVGHQASVNIGFMKSFLQVRDYAYIIQEGPNIADNRNLVFRKAKELGRDLLFIDSDMIFKREDVEAIEGLLGKLDVVTGLCVLSAEGHPPSVFKNEDGEFKTAKVKRTIFEVDACGAAFLGISNRVIQKLDDPFKEVWDEKRKAFYGEDISFCIRAKEAGFKIACDPAVRIGHLKPKVLYF